MSRCKDCGDGRRLGINAWGDPMCAACAARHDAIAAAKHAEVAAKAHAEAVRRLATESRLPARTVRYLGGWSDRDACPDAHKWAAARVRITEPGDRAGIFMHGKPGTGKTLRAVALGMAAVHAGRSVLYATEHDIITATRSMFGGGREDWLAATRTARLLIVDDFAGVEARTDLVHDTMAAIIMGRLNDDRATVIASNIAPEFIIDAAGMAVERRIREFYEVTT